MDSYTWFYIKILNGKIRGECENQYLCLKRYYKPEKYYPSDLQRVKEYGSLLNHKSNISINKAKTTQSLENLDLGGLMCLDASKVLLKLAETGQFHLMLLSR